MPKLTVAHRIIPHSAGVPAGVPDKALWQSSDFTLLGISYSMGNSSRAYGITGIREAGVFKLLEWIEDDHVYKYTPPSPSASQTYNVPPSPSGPVDTGIPYGTYDGSYWQAVAPLATSELTPFALFYDDGVSPARLYWTSPSKYDVSFVAQPCIGYSTWSGSAWVPVGNWCLSTTRALGGYGNRWAHCMGLLPTWFSTNFAGGRRYWVGGSGGNFVSIVSNDVSYGPTLFAINALAGTETWKAVATSADPKPLLFYPYHDGDLSVVNYPTATNDGYLHLPRIARRHPGLGVHNKYMNSTITTPDDKWLPDVSSTDGYWDWQGDSAPGSIWLETTNKFGWITFPTLIRGNYRQVISSISYVGRISGVDWWDITVPTTTGLEPNMQVFVEDSGSPHYGGFLCEVNHSANTGPYNPNLPDSISTTNPILSGTVVRVWNTESSGGFEDMAGAAGNPISAGAYYGGGGGKPSAFRTFWYVYDPADLAVQAQNLVGPWSELEPASVWAFAYDRRRETYVAGSRPPIVTAAVFDDVANVLYLRVYLGDLSPTGGVNQHVIYHFQVTP